MSGVKKNERKPSKYDADHYFLALRREVTNLMFMDFGFSKDKYYKFIKHKFDLIRGTPGYEGRIQTYRKRCEEFYNWFIPDEKQKVSEILRNIAREINMSSNNTPMPGKEQPKEVQLQILIHKQAHLDEAIRACNDLRQEIQFILRQIPCVWEKYERYNDLLKKQVNFLKYSRRKDMQAYNRLKNQ